MSKKSNKLAHNVDKRRLPKSEEAYKEQRRNESRVLNAQRRASERDVTSNINDKLRWVDWERREACGNSLKLFAETYFSVMCRLDWSDAHIRCLDRMQHCIENGGQFAFAMPRGSGKTSLSEVAPIWSILYGKRRYVVLIAAKEGKARELMKDIKTFLRFNRLLKKDFPEVLYPIEAINNNARKAETQTYNGEPTEITWVANKIVMPSLIDFEYPEDADGITFPSGIIETAGITGDIRGRHHTLTSGEIVRPDFAIIDDPSTAESAKSPDQNKARIDITNADILGLGGPDEKIAAFMPCTIIQNNDMAQQVLADPNWHGEISSMIIEWPENMELWDEYNKVRLEGAKNMDSGKSARQFYEDNREALEKGAKVSWESRKFKDEVTALQNAMNLYYEHGERAFYSEYQNQPLSEFANLLDIEPHMVRSAAIGTKNLEVPQNCVFLAAMIDINVRTGLHYTVLASTNSMEVHCPYYGRYPEDVNQSLWTRENTGGLTEIQAVFNAILSVTNTINAMNFTRGGQRVHCDIISVDCGYLMDTVFSAVAAADRNLAHTKVVCSRGYAQKGWRETKVVGKAADNCYRSYFDGKGAVVKHNADYWRERVHQSFLLGAGAPGSITLFGQPDAHVYFSEHICGERLLEHFQTEKDEYYNWQRVPGRANDLLDSTVGALALFSILGASFDGGLRMNVKKAGAQPKVKEATYTEL